MHGNAQRRRSRASKRACARRSRTTSSRGPTSAHVPSSSLPRRRSGEGARAFRSSPSNARSSQGSLPSQAVAGVLADVRRAETHLVAGRFEEAKLYARALDRPERFGYDVVLVARAAKKPHALSGSEYEPGEIEGQAYVYDFAAGRVVCAGEILAKSSREIGYVYSDRSDTPPSLGPVASMGDAIHDDIRLQTERAIVAAVRWRSGPRPRER